MKRTILIVEYSSISYGMGVLDRLIKKSVIVPLYAKPICIGKFLMIFSGDVEDLRESEEVIRTLCVNRLISTFLITSAHSDITDYFLKKRNIKEQYTNVEAVGIFETRNASSGIFSLDACLKNGSVTLLKLGIGHYLGGKCYYLLTGTVSDVQQAFIRAQGVLSESDFVGSEVIASPDRLTLNMLLDGYNSMGTSMQ